MNRAKLQACKPLGLGLLQRQFTLFTFTPTSDVLYFFRQGIKIPVGSHHLLEYDTSYQWLIENSRFPQNIDIPWNIGEILGDSPEY